MKLRPFLAAALFAVATLAGTSGSHALTVADGYSASPYYTPPPGETVVSFDWDPSGNLYYVTADDIGYFTGLFQWNGVTTTRLLDGAPGTEFSANNLVYLDGGLFFNPSDFTATYVRRYDLASGTVSHNVTTPGYFLTTSGGTLFQTGAPDFTTTRFYASGVEPSGALSNHPPVEFGQVSGFSGPLAFDAAGNLYYATGFGAHQIYRWSASEVAAALAEPLGNPLEQAGHLWADYSALFSGVDGGSAMTFDEEGNLVITLTSFVSTSHLAVFEVDENGLFAGASTLLSSSERLTDLRFYDGNLYVGVDGTILQVVPEPSGLLFLAVAGIGAWAFRRRRKAAAAAVLLMAGAAAHAGPYSIGLEDPDNPYDAPIPGFVGPAGDGLVHADNEVNPIFVGWATRVISYLPAPGVQPGFADPTKTLGPVTANNFDIVALGDLYDPANPPSKDGSPVDPNDPDDGYGFIGYDAPGSITVGFDAAIRNGEGADFAVFGNGFVSLFTTGDGSVVGRMMGELAYVEVSTDGVNFARMPSISLTEDLLGNYGTFDPSDIYNLAGKTSNGFGESWGTPFDLDDLLTDGLVLDGTVNLDEINYVRLVDIPGDGTFLDSLGNPIYDAWVTWGSGGFDFEALGVIHAVPEPSVWALTTLALGAGWLRWKRAA